jgi:hypothetical protein
MVSPANCIQEKFIEDLTEQLFPPHQHSEVQKFCFQLRFHPSNWHNVDHTQIADQISKQLNGGFSESSINPTVGDVVKKVKDKFETKMQADGVEIEKLNPGRGKPKESPWQIVYKWLWETEFPRRGWQLSKEMAVCAIEQLQMKPMVVADGNRNLDLEGIPDVTEGTIRKGEGYKLQVDLPSKGYLLLINEGVNGEKYCICPSRAFALPEPLFLATPLSLPLEEAIARNVGLSFKAVGDEYFLAIVTEQPLSLSWVRPDSHPKDIVVDDKRLHEIFKLLGQQSNCYVFYKNFVVTD